MTPETVLRLSRGFSCAFWGLILTIVFAARAPFSLPGRWMFIPPYLLGLGVILVGMLILSRAPPPSEEWKRWLARARLATLVVFYLAPFAYWWRAMPYVRYYAANFVALYVAAAVAFFCMNALAAEAGRALEARTLHVEARLCAWLSLLSVLVPGGILAARWWWAVWRSGGGPWLPPPATVLPWLGVVSFAPTLLTSMMLREVVETGFRRLVREAALNRPS